MQGYTKGQLGNAKWPSVRKLTKTFSAAAAPASTQAGPSTVPPTATPVALTSPSVEQSDGEGYAAEVCVLLYM